MTVYDGGRIGARSRTGGRAPPAHAPRRTRLFAFAYTRLRPSGTRSLRPAACRRGPPLEPHRRARRWACAKPLPSAALTLHLVRGAEGSEGLTGWSQAASIRVRLAMNEGHGECFDKGRRTHVVGFAADSWHGGHKGIHFHGSG